jgi:GNAT superfamily N-acetyltransferase
MLTRGWHTDLAVLRHGGSSIEDRGDHVVVRTPANPTFHWGNFVLVTDPATTEDAGRWVGTFKRVFPGAGHVALGLPGLPAGDAYAAAGLEVGTDDVLYATARPEQRPLADGYTARPLTTEDDWEQNVAGALAENERTGEYDRAGHEEFLRRRADQHRALCAADVARFFGAFTADGQLVSDLGIVDCDGLARYQSVGTDAAHRRQGLAGHLIGLAAGWAAERGCTEWVIVTETTNAAGRLYRSVGFEPDAVQVSAYRH